jgi:Fe-S-cluster containining protein
MSASLEPATAVAEVDLVIGNGRLRTRVEVPSTPMSPSGLLPLARALASAAVDAAVEDARGKGRTISCKAGCGACCRQLVPVTQVEARMLGTLVQEMPEPRRSEILARFDRARKRLAEAEMLSALENRDRKETLVQLGLRYFALGIPCPFLENESCSIYEDRPLICREYLVTSPAEACRAPTPETVHCLPLSFKVSASLARATAPRSSASESQDPGVNAAGSVVQVAPWIALTLALEWAADNPEGAPEWTGPELVSRFFEELSGRDLPPPTLPALGGGNGDGR